MPDNQPAFLPSMILFHPAERTCAYLNRHCKEMLGYERAELSSKQIADLVHPDDLAELDTLMAGEVARCGARIRDISGQWHLFSWKTRSLKDALYLLGIASEFMERNEAWYADDRYVPQTTLKETLSMMARIVEAKNPGMRCSILLLDKNQEYVEGGAGPSLPEAYNKAVEGLNIGPQVGSCGTAAFWNIPVVVEDIYSDPLWENLRDAAKIAGVKSCWSHPVTNSSGKVLGAMALYNDTPRTPERHHMDGLAIAARMVGLAVERDQLENQLRQAAKLEALGVLAGGIAHDFNNLLMTIIGNTEMAMLTLGDKSQAGTMLKEIMTASTKATELCHQMLAYAGQGAFSTEYFNCNEELRELGSLLTAGLSKKAHILYQLDADEPAVMGDRSQLRQVL